MLNGISVCSGRINPLTCTNCVYASKEIPTVQRKALYFLSKSFYSLGFDPSVLNSTIGTAIGYPFVVKRKHESLIRLTDVCDKVITLTKWYERVLKQNGVNPDKIAFIPQALPSFSVKPTKEKNIFSDEIKLVFVGRISPFKGLHILIEAIKSFDTNLISLDIYGFSSGDDYENNLRKASRFYKNIKWCGGIEPGNAVEVMSSYDALCLPSTFSEMSPLVIQEAFSAGIPIIASNVYGNTEQIKHNINGLLFEFNNSDSLRMQLKNLLDEPELLSKLKANIIQPDTFEKVGNAYLQLYSDLVTA
nr:glycosyltransferase [Pontibacter sp. Tf4]